MALVASTVIAGIGLAVTGAGLALNYTSQKDAADANAAAAGKQAEIAGIQAANVDNQKDLLSLQTQQQQIQIQSNKDVIGQQQQADDLRQQAAQLDATRRIRESVRQGIVANSASLTAATNQGAGQPGSTAVKQAAGDIAGQTNVNILGITQQSEFGKKLYDINKSISNIYLNAQDANSVYVNQSKDIQNKVLDTQKQVYALGGQVSQDYATAATAQGNAAIGQGLAGIGNAVTSNYATLNRITNYFGSSSSTPSYGASSSTGNANGLGGLY